MDGKICPAARAAGVAVARAREIVMATPSLHLGQAIQDVIAARFHTSPSRVRGTNRFLLVLQCSSSLKTVLAYQTVVERDAAWEQYQNRKCGYLHCCFDHVKANL
jgi:hypothetical protein